jgi:TIR domain
MCSLDAEHGQLADYAALPGSGLPARLFQPHCALHHSAFAHAREIMAVEDAFASHAQATPEAISAPIGKSPDPAVRESGQEPKTKVFISYSRKGIAFADRLDAALWARGFEPLIDRTDIYAFEEWWKRVEDLITCADTVVFVLSPDAVKPDTVALKEVAFAASQRCRKPSGYCQKIQHPLARAFLGIKLMFEGPQLNSETHELVFYDLFQLLR